MTVEEIENWMRTKSLDEIVLYIVMADDWENSTPKLKFPDVYALLDDKGDLYVMFEGGMIVTIGTIRPLEYAWTLTEYIIEDFYVEKRKPKWPWFAVGGSCILGGLILGAVIH